MIHIVKTFTTLGLIGHEITIEIDSNRSLPMIEIIGLGDTTIKESKERIRSTLKHANIDLPARKIILNLAPSDLKKSGTSFDLPMAIGLMLLASELPSSDFLNNTLFFGELGLDGTVKRINGLLPCILAAIKQGYDHFVIPHDNLYECEYIKDITLIPLKHFSQLKEFFLEGHQLLQVRNAKKIEELSPSHYYGTDFKDIKGHTLAKRALTIAAAGLHNVLMTGAPGSGKTLLSKAVQSILPPLNFPEILEVSQIYSIIGKLDKHHPLITQRPFRAVHHTASKVSIIGGGSQLHPGEISLAHKGILFFDELPEFPREVLEVLRQPIEDKVVMISRASGSVEYPANIMFVAAMNPCKCGFYKDREKPCSCSMMDIKKYQSKISGPLLDRIDMILEIPRENIETLIEKHQSESSETLRMKVHQARQIQQKRYQGTDIASNADLDSKTLEYYITLDDACQNFLKQSAQRLQLSGRVLHRMIKLARTIADMESQDHIALSHLTEAFHYRSKSMFIEGI